jgi:uncharacterized protein YcbK (DUF882 family)
VASEHFQDHELACPCCGVTKVPAKTFKMLEDLRSLIGGRPVMINSGYRCQKHNGQVGGAKNSQHVKGLAVDVRVTGMLPESLANYVEQIPEVNGIGLDTLRRFVHMDCRPGPRVKWKYGPKGEIVAW